MVCKEEDIDAKFLNIELEIVKNVLNLLKNSKEVVYNYDKDDYNVTVSGRSLSLIGSPLVDSRVPNKEKGKYGSNVSSEGLE